MSVDSNYLSTLIVICFKMACISLCPLGNNSLILIKLKYNTFDYGYLFINYWHYYSVAHNCSLLNEVNSFITKPQIYASFFLKLFSTFKLYNSLSIYPIYLFYGHSIVNLSADTFWTTASHISDTLLSTYDIFFSKLCFILLWNWTIVVLLRPYQNFIANS